MKSPSGPEMNTEDVRALLTAMEDRQRAFNRTIKSGSERSLEETTALPATDDRKCDYSIAPVATRPPKRSSMGTNGTDQDYGGILETKSECNDSKLNDDKPTSASSSVMRWRYHLEMHIVQLLRDLRDYPEKLRELLLLQYEIDDNLVDGNADNDGDVDGNQHGLEKHRGAISMEERQKQRRKGHDKQYSEKYAHLRQVYQTLRLAASDLGERLHQQVYRMVRRSVAQGLLSKEANQVRLESVYKLELRRHVTIEKLLELVKANIAEQRKKRRRQQTNERTRYLNKKVVSPPAASSLETDETLASRPEDSGVKALTFWDSKTNEVYSAKSIHNFKIQALERVLAMQWRQQDANNIVPRQGSTGNLSSGYRLISEQTNELIQEKVTAFLYNRKNRDNFPFWKDPPGSLLSREETARYLRGVLALLLTTPLFQVMTIDQLLDVVRVTKWEILNSGHIICQEGTPMEYLIILMDGKVSSEPIKQPATTETPDSETVDVTCMLDQDPTDPMASNFTLAPACVGELGMINREQLWLSTLVAVTQPTKVLTLTRSAFDDALQKIFGGSKSKAQFSSSQRPSSSSAIDNRRLRTIAVSPQRPSTAAAKEQNIAASRKSHEENLQRLLVQKNRERETTPKRGKIPETAENGNSRNEQKIDQTADRIDAVDNQNAPSMSARKDSLEGRNRMFQYYPSFASTVPGGGAFNLFRLKWMHPIAFPMDPVDVSIGEELAPSFPDTFAMVDFLSPSSLSSLNLIFDKKSALLKDQLRSMCLQHPLLNGAYFNHTSQKHNENGAAKAAANTNEKSTGGDSSLLTQEKVAMASKLAVDTSVSSTTATAVTSPLGGGENEVMTFAQFTEARRKMFGRSNTKLGSMRHLNGSAMFSKSSFIRESSFYAGRHRGVKQQETKLDATHSDSEESDNESVIGDEKAMDSNAIDLTTQQLVPKVTVDTASEVQQPEDHDSDGDSKDTIGEISAKTHARKMALDSLLFLNSTSSRKSKLISQETAQLVIIQKHMEAINTDSSNSPLSARKASVLQTQSGKTPTSEPPPVPNNSHAPLPLRIDLQKRMEVVLSELQMKPKAKLDLVLKYTHADHYDRFPMAVVMWEQALQFVLKRERILQNLRKFELVASDPRRHFRSLSTHRLAEQKQRDSLFCQLKHATDLCQQALDELSIECRDDLFFGERLYKEKMKKDYTELLYQVEQERLEMIYKDVRPAVAIPTPKYAPAGNTQDDSDSCASPPRQVLASCQPRMEDEVEAVCVQINAESPFTLEGSSTHSGARFQLANPRESIFVSLGDKKLEEEQEREAKDGKSEDGKNHSERKHILATHRVAAQVQRQRQAELSALAQKSQTQQQNLNKLSHGSNMTSLTTLKEGKQGNKDDQSMENIRPPTSTNSTPTDLRLLQQALHRFIHRPNK